MHIDYAFWILIHLALSGTASWTIALTRKHQIKISSPAVKRPTSSLSDPPPVGITTRVDNE